MPNQTATGPHSSETDNLAEILCGLLRGTAENSQKLGCDGPCGGCGFMGQYLCCCSLTLLIKFITGLVGLRDRHRAWNILVPFLEKKMTNLAKKTVGTKTTKGRRILKDTRRNAIVSNPLDTIIDWRNAPAGETLKRLGVEMVGNIIQELLQAETREANRRSQLNTACFNLVYEVSTIQGRLGNAVPSYKILLGFAQETMGMIAEVKVIKANGQETTRKELRSPGNLTHMLQDSLRQAMVMVKAEANPEHVVVLPGSEGPVTHKLGDIVKRADGRTDKERKYIPGSNKTSRKTHEQVIIDADTLLANWSVVSPNIPGDGDTLNENTNPKKVRVIYRGTPVTRGIDNLFYATYPSEKPKPRNPKPPVEVKTKKMTFDQALDFINQCLEKEIKKNTAGAYSTNRLARLASLNINSNTLQDMINETDEQV